MAGDKVKKGFLFYLMMLLLFIIATVFILVVVMVFNPGLNILGYKYFSCVDEATIVEPSKDMGKISLSNATDIVVNGEMINFEIDRDSKVEDVTIKIQNYQTGFAKSSQNTDFNYEVIYTNSGNGRKLLSIEVNNPDGFLYFNSNCYVKILIPADQVVNEQTTLSATVDKGNISLGSEGALLDEEKTYFEISNVSLVASEANIKIGKYFNPVFSQLSINNENGSVEAGDLKFANDGKFSISGNNADFSFKDISFEKSASEINAGLLIDYNLQNGTFSANNVNASMHLKTRSSVINIENFNGTFDGNDLVSTINQMTLNINKAVGEISLPFAESSSINISDASECKIFVNANNATIKINKLAQGSWIETKNGSINVSLAETEGDITLVSESASINVTCDDKMKNIVDISSITGNVNVNYNPNTNFTVKFYNSNGTNRTSNIEIENYQGDISQGLYINGGGTIWSISSDANISFKVI